MSVVNELSIEDKLKQLFELQLVDSELDQIQILKGELPMEVSDLEDEIAGLETRLEKLSQQIKELESESSNHQINIKESEANITRYQKQLEDVKNNREFDALNKEIEMQKLEIQLSEKKIRESKVQIGMKQETFDAANKRMTVRKKDYDQKKNELKKIIDKTEKDETKLKNRSDKARKNVETRLLKAYDKIRTRYRNGLSVVTIKRQSCGGCFNKIPPQLQLEIGLRKKIVACEHCGRVLVDNDIAFQVATETGIVAPEIMLED